MAFNGLPFEMQLEIVKYNENFRRINTTFYNKGYMIFKECYMNKPITMNEFSKYYFNSNDGTPIIIYSYNNLDVTIYVMRSQCCIETFTIQYNPESVKPEFYIAQICIYQKRYWRPGEENPPGLQHAGNWYKTIKTRIIENKKLSI